MADKRVYIIGAGFSAHLGIPTVAGLFPEMMKKARVSRLIDSNLGDDEECFRAIQEGERGVGRKEIQVY